MTADTPDATAQDIADPWDGVPLTPEQNGWHWCQEGGALEPGLWIASRQCWHVYDGRGDLLPWKVAHWTYLGPCVPPALLATEPAPATVAPKPEP